MNIEKSFKKFDQPNYYSRVDSTHPLDLWYGLDEHGRRCIELRANFKPRPVKGTDAIEINQYSNKANHHLSLIHFFAYTFFSIKI